MDRYMKSKPDRSAQRNTSSFTSSPFSLLLTKFALCEGGDVRRLLQRSQATRWALHSVLVALLELRGTKVGSLHVVVTAGPFLSVSLEGCFVLGQSGVLQLEWLWAAFHWGETSASCGLECLSSWKSSLEVHPVLSGLSEFILYRPTHQGVMHNWQLGWSRMLTFWYECLLPMSLEIGMYLL